MSTGNFSSTSRYYSVETATIETDDGNELTYVKRRFIPSPDRYSLLFEHVVSESDRIDNIAARYLGDPEQFWRICDANAAMRPNDLTDTVGKRIRITLPEGIPGTPSA